jgi:ABC-type phosphate transport system substrate-binding protein
MDAHPPPPAGRRSVVLLLAAVAVLASAFAVPAALGAEDGDGVVVVVSAENPLTEIPRLHLADLYLGRTKRFPNGEPAVPIDLAPESPIRKEFYDTYLGRSQAEIKAHWSKIIFTGRGRPPKALPTGEEVKELVAGDPGAVGYIERRLVDDSVRIVRVE